MADADWTAGHTLTVAIQASFQGQVSPDAPGCTLKTGALQSDPTHPIPCYGQLNNPSAWPFDTVVVSVSCDSPTVQVGAVVSFSDMPANMPAPILPPGYVPGTI